MYPALDLGNDDLIARVAGFEQLHDAPALNWFLGLDGYISDAA
jgi:hypothetical protein